jgi:myo-inositol-1(or 4)-monophosphatase
MTVPAWHRGHLRDIVHFSTGIALCPAAGCVITGLRGPPLHTGAGGLIAAADDATHATLIEIINQQFTL